MTAFGHGFVVWHAWPCRALGLSLPLPGWVPDPLSWWLACRVTEVSKEYGSMAEAIAGRQEVLAEIGARAAVEGLSVEVHIDAGRLCVEGAG